MSKKEVNNYYCTKCRRDYSVDATEDIKTLFCESCDIELKFINKTVVSYFTKEYIEERNWYYLELCKEFYND